MAMATMKRRQNGGTAITTMTPPTTAETFSSGGKARGRTRPPPASAGEAEAPRPPTQMARRKRAIRRNMPVVATETRAAETRGPRNGRPVMATAMAMMPPLPSTTRTTTEIIPRNATAKRGPRANPEKEKLPIMATMTTTTTKTVPGVAVTKGGPPANFGEERLTPSRRRKAPRQIPLVVMLVAVATTMTTMTTRRRIKDEEANEWPSHRDNEDN
mmetsp:Transcript_42638/g.129482  ORF Transcript_42638/g.129482 Transcript_42638/m.129482 type:complete len:215 (+) Transcript_42638:162-806(+)